MSKQKKMTAHIEVANELDVPVVLNGDGAAGAPFVTPLPRAPERPVQLPHVPDKVAELSPGEVTGLKGGDEEC